MTYKIFLLLLATLAGATLIYRAAKQAVVIDEADSYILFAEPEGLASAIYPSSGNHLLNTYLVRATTRAFGLSELTLRLPAIVGGVLYIGFALSLVFILEAGWAVSVPLFICLAFNPLILDYLIAARGYSLALGFFMAALALLARDRHPALVSICIGLSFSANFSFAFVDIVLLLLTARRKRLIATFVPAVAVVSLLCGWTLLHWPMGQFYWGSLSFSEMWTGIFANSFADPLPFFARVFPKSVEARTRMIVSTLDAVFAVPLIVVALREKPSPRLTFLKHLFALLTLTFLVHWCAFVLGHLRLPLTRTGLFFLPISTLIVGVSLAISRPWIRQIGTSLLLLNALWFVACFRTGYFLEWRYNSDAKAIYNILRGRRSPCALDDVTTEWRYSSSLNFYRRYYHDDAFKDFEPVFRPYPEGRRIYVLYGPDAKLFIPSQGLQIAYSNPKTNAVVAQQNCNGR